MTSYNRVRIISFTGYVVISGLFAWLLIFLGTEDMRKASDFAERERTYIERLMTCSSALDEAIRGLGQSGDNLRERIECFSTKFDLLKKSVNQLTDGARGAKVQIKLERLKSHMMRAGSALDSMQVNLSSADIDSNIIIQNDLASMSLSLSDSAEIIHSLVSGEYEQAGLWQRQSMFFFRRLQYLLVTFFILTTLFIVLSSSYSGFLLKKYLGLLSEGTKQISSGNLKYRFKGIESDEMGSLMADFNSMALRLEEQTLELMKINKMIEEKAQQLIEANLHKDRFFANMSHELRTPLNSIIGFSDLNIERTGYSKENLVENSRKILSAAEHLLSLISGLLDVAKADAGVLAPNLAEHKLSDTLVSVVEMLRPLAERKKLSLSIEDAEEICFLYDEKMLKQSIINLISNAIKFTHEGRVVARLRKEKDAAVIEIEDSGIGISPENQKRIFNDFHRVESGLTSNYEGVGLGLALSRRLVRLHGGEIALSSTLGKGSIFFIRLPLKDNSIYFQEKK